MSFPSVTPVRACALALAALVTFGISGCSKGPTMQKVSGKLVVDGQPAAGANILFFTPGQKGGVVPSANTGPDGTFQIFSNGQPGVLPGSYSVTVVWPDPAKAAEAAADRSGKSDPPDLLGGKYSVPGSSPLKAEIGSGTKELAPFEIATK